MTCFERVQNSVAAYSLFSNVADFRKEMVLKCHNGISLANDSVKYILSKEQFNFVISHRSPHPSALH